MISAKSELIRNGVEEESDKIFIKVSTNYRLLVIFSLMKDLFLTWLNRFLVFDVFLVLFSFFWLVIAVVGRSLDLSLGLDLWYKLWEPVFTPALGILMGGAILSGIVSQISKRLNPRG